MERKLKKEMKKSMKSSNGWMSKMMCNNDTSPLFILYNS